MKLAILLLYIIPAVFALPSHPDVSQPLDDSRHKSTVCSDMVYGDFNVVVCQFGDTSVLHWPPAFLNRLNISNPYDANCFKFTFNNVTTNFLCDHGDVEVIHWSKEAWQSQDETNVGVHSLDVALAGEPKTPEEITDELLFDTPLADFIAHRKKRNPKTLIWDSDGCTHAPDNPMGFPFTSACQRHDFGYRNYRAQNRLVKNARKDIEDNFKAE